MGNDTLHVLESILINGGIHAIARFQDENEITTNIDDLVDAVDPMDSRTWEIRPVTATLLITMTNGNVVPVECSELLTDHGCRFLRMCQRGTPWFFAKFRMARRLAKVRKYLAHEARYEYLLDDILRLSVMVEAEKIQEMIASAKTSIANSRVNHLVCDAPFYPWRKSSNGYGFKTSIGDFGTGGFLGE